MSRHQALQERLTAIEARLSLRPSRRNFAGPIRRHDAADPVSPVLQALLTEVLPGAQVLDWRHDAGGHAGRMVAEGLVYRFRVDGSAVAYRPAWDGVQQRGWDLRSVSFLELRVPTARMDFRQGSGATAGQKRKCATGYSCGAACISLQKECRISPSTAMGKARLRRLQQLAGAGNKAAENTASQVSAARRVAAGERQKERNARRVEKLLARPEIAEYLRTGKLPKAASASTDPGTVRNMEPGEIVFDPGRFQYKLNATEGTGEVGSLAGVRRWDPNLAGVMSVWKDPADGKVYVVNGHNRLSLARRLGAEEVTVRFLHAKNATEARAIGAMQNIAEGAGTPMDAAKFFRDTGIKSKADVEAKGLPLGSGQADKGLRLSKLPTDVFNAVVRGDLSVNRGAIIGGSGLDEAKQREVFTMIKARKGIADQTLLELVEHAAASVQREQTTFDLFGESQEAKDNLFTRAKLSAGLKAKISKEKRLFGTVSKAKAASSLTEKAGNVINQEQSAKVAREASEALAVFERLKSSSGPISSALNRAADRVEAGESETKVRQELERDVFAAVEQELVSLGLRKRSRADSLQERIDALKRKCSTGYGCGSACISLQKECRSNPGSTIGRERLKRLLALAAGGPSSQRGIGTVKAGEAGEMAQAITANRAQRAAQLRGARARQLQKAHEQSAGRSGHHPGNVGREVLALYDQTMPLFQQPAAAAGPRQTHKISDVLRATTEQLKAADARQMGKIAENLFEAGWTIDRRTRYRGMSKDQAREQFKVEFMQKMQQQAASPEAAANSAAMRQRAGASGSLAGAMKSILEDMKAQDQRLEDLQRQSIDLRIQAEEQFGAQGGADPNLGGGRPRRRLGGSRRSGADRLEARIDALRIQCTPVAR